MCHLILLMPLLALPIFWLVPLNYALPIYILITLISGMLYWLVAKSMGKQPETGAESLIRAVAEVVSKLSTGGHAQYLVRSQGELWSADSPENLKTGEMVSISAVDGIRLTVRRKANLIASAEDGVRKMNERHGH